MDDHQDFNSDDIEIPEQLPDRWAAAGARTIESMILSAANDRISSKIAVKTLKFTSAPSTEYRRAKYGKEFEAFRTSTLGRAPDSVPDAEQIERFIAALPGHVRGQSGPSKSLPNFTTISGAVCHVVAHCRFQYEGFQFSKRAAERIVSSLKAMVRAGTITREVKERVWLQHNILAKMLRALLSDGLDRGTPCWDVVINGALGLSLETALACRPGDVARSEFGGDECCLCWGDIDLTLEKGDNGQARFTALLTLRFTKGKKERPDANHKAFLRQLPGSETNALCAVSYLIIHALRTGAVAETSYAELVDRYSACPGDPVVWTRPKAPVLCASYHRIQLCLDQPANYLVLLVALKRAAQLAGLLHNITAHAIRRGAAAESAHLGPKVQYSEILAQRALGHSNQTAYHDTTFDKYIGHVRHDIFAERVKAGPLEGSAHDVRLANEGYKPGKISTKDVTDYCVGKGTDAEDSRARHSAARSLRLEHNEAWKQSQKGMQGARGAKQAIDTSSGAPAVGEESALPSDPHTSPLLHGGSASFSPCAQEVVEDPKPASPHGHEAADLDSDDDFDMGLVDPALTRELHDLIHNDETLLPALGLAPEEDQDPAHDWEQQRSADAGIDAADTTDIFAADRGVFIDFFSKINVVKSERDGPRLTMAGAWALALETYPRGSLDPPSRFTLICPNFGCNTAWYVAAHFRAHVAACKYADVNYAEAHPHKCAVQDCSSAFDSPEALADHVGQYHEFVPRTCGAVDCDSTEVFHSRSALVIHSETAHFDFSPQQCAVRDCTHEKVYDRVASYKNHLRRKHQELSAEEIAELLPQKKARRANQTNKKRPAELHSTKYTPQQCSHPDCKSRTNWLDLGSYLRHLKLTHGIVDDADLVLFVLSAADLVSE